MILQSSLTIVFSLALEYSSWGRVSVLGTGFTEFKLEAFLRGMKSSNSLLGRPFTMHHNFRLCAADLPTTPRHYLPHNPVSGKTILPRHSITFKKVQEY